MVINKEFYMDLALKEAWRFQFLTYPNPAVGCVILDRNEKILSIKAHEIANDCHAELNAVKEALKYLNKDLNIPNEPQKAHDFVIKNHNNLLKDALAFVTLEPCAHFGKTPPCVDLFIKLKFKKIFISIKDNNKIASGGIELLKKAGIEYELGILEKEGQNLIKPFLKWQKNIPYKLFKLALSFNGSLYGKVVSSLQSRIYSHKIRDKIDLLVVGGNTIRLDRPILDARLCDGKAPNLCILSKKYNFDKNIKCFNIPRKIYKTIPKEAKFIMYEGGINFLKSFYEDMDVFLIFSNSNFNTYDNIKINLKFKALYKGSLGDDNYGIYEIE